MFFLQYHHLIEADVVFHHGVVVAFALGFVHLYGPSSLARIQRTSKQRIRQNLFPRHTCVLFLGDEIDAPLPFCYRKRTKEHTENTPERKSRTLPHNFVPTGCACHSGILSSRTTRKSIRRHCRDSRLENCYVRLTDSHEKFVAAQKKKRLQEKHDAKNVLKHLFFLPFWAISTLSWWSKQEDGHGPSPWTQPATRPIEPQMVPKKSELPPPPS